jgi:hypothetical protein
VRGKWFADVTASVAWGVHRAAVQHDPIEDKKALSKIFARDAVGALSCAAAKPRHRVAKLWSSSVDFEYFDLYR